VSLAIGLAAAALTIASFVAQSWKILRTRDVRGVSAPMWALSTTAFAIWVGYGALLGEWPIIAANLICGALAGFILVLVLLPRRRRERIADSITSAVARSR
jgi:MtN3 and saliva related transmembrane protein